MTPPTAAVESDREGSTTAKPAESETSTDRASQVSALDGGIRVLIGLAVATVAAATCLRIAYNVPFDPLAFPSRAVPVADAVAGVGAGAALAALGLASARPLVRVGLLFSGVFGLLAIGSPSAAVAATVAIPGGVALALASAFGRPTTYVGLRRRAVALAFPVAVGVTLASTTWRIGTGLRGAGSVAFLLVVTLLAVRTRDDRVALVAGGGGFLGVVAASAAAPYVTGSVLLAGFGVVGSPHLLVATAAFGGVAALVAGVRAGDRPLALGAALVLLAGVPATPGAALAACLGGTLATVDGDELLAAPEVTAE